MGYNPQNAKEQALLPPDSILDGAVIDIRDGVTKDFITKTEGWKGDLDSPAINVGIEVKDKNKSVVFSQLFTYALVNGVTIYTPNSNIGKFKKKYGNLPMVGTKVKVVTNKDSFCRVKLD